MKSRLNNFFFYFSIILLLALLGFIGFLIYKSFSYKSEVSLIMSETVSVAKRNASLSSVKGALEDAEKYMDLVSARFIKEDDIPGFISDIEALGAREAVNANIVSVSLDKPDPKANTQSALRSLRMRIDGTASWQNSMEFISALESMPSALTVQAVSVSRSPGPSPETANFWRFTIDIIQYVSN